jgi:hypothetical protein
MSENLFYKLGKGSLQEAKDTLKKLLPDLGEIAVYLDGDNQLGPAYRELLILSNIRFLEGLDKEPGSIRLDFFKAYIKSRRKLVVSDQEISEYKEELL